MSTDPSLVLSVVSLGLQGGPECVGGDEECAALADRFEVAVGLDRAGAVSVAGCGHSPAECRAKTQEAPAPEHDPGEQAEGDTNERVHVDVADGVDVSVLRRRHELVVPDPHRDARQRHQSKTTPASSPTCPARSASRQRQGRVRDPGQQPCRRDQQQSLAIHHGSMLPLPVGCGFVAVTGHRSVTGTTGQVATCADREDVPGCRPLVWQSTWLSPPRATW